MKNLELKKQQRSFLKLNRIIISIVFLIICLAIVILQLFKSIELLHIGIILINVLVLYILIYLYQGAAYKYFSYAMNEHGLYINRGVLWRRKIVVPRNRVQHTDVNQGPIERKYDLAELIVHTAGTRNASVKLPGILHKDAEKLRESLSFDESNDAV